MFNTEHLSGRCVYETDKVVCINVYLSKTYSSSKDIFLSQLLVSLVNTHFSYGSISFTCDFFDLTLDQFNREIEEGVKQYRKCREALGLLQ